MNHPLRSCCRFWLGVACALCLALAPSAACNGAAKGKSARAGRDGGDDAKPDPTPCDRLAEHVTLLYRAEAVPAPAADNADLARRHDESITDGVAMILGDCRTDPPRFAACIEQAAALAALEQGCVVPLDDQGAVEARLFAD
jgi:hypothetical protein